MVRFKTLRLILGDQLNYNHSWFKNTDDEVLYVLMEVRQETDYVLHHIQKIIVFFASMYNFAAWLRKNGHQIHHFLINDPENTQSIEGNLNLLVSRYNIERLEYMLPDEYRLDILLKNICERSGLSYDVFDTEHFMTSRFDFTAIFKNRKTYLMESFYRHMRKKYNILMDGFIPVGGNWNYDKENRAMIKTTEKIPEPMEFHHNYSDIFAEIEKAGIKFIGNSRCNDFPWPTSRKQSLQLMHYFNEKMLPDFGKYQDAMHTDSWSVFHSRLSFAMNIKMISPIEVVHSAIDKWKSDPVKVSLPQIEGYVRQIIGWREYMRGVYWAEMPLYAQLNKLENDRKLPGWYWTGKTRMNCLRHAIKQSLDFSYAHHIQRLMVTGNFALLTGVHPDEVDLWYLGIYIDAVEWVEMPNTRGMSQYADGGIVGTKPYVSSANYLDKMSNYCKGCYYDKSKKLGEKACPFNSLYWHFYMRNEAKLRQNPRIGMAYIMLDKMSIEDKNALTNQAEHYLDTIETL